MPVRTTLPRDGTVIQREIQDKTERAIRQLEASVLDGMTLVPATVNATDTRVYHGLGRVPLGYWIVRCASVGVTVADGLSPETADPQNYIILRCSAGTTALTLAVF